MREAVDAEESGSIMTCRAIIKDTMKYGLEDRLEMITEEDEK